MKKRILSLILAVAMVLALFPAAAFADGAADPLPSEELSELIPEEAMGDMVYVNWTCNVNATHLSVTVKNGDTVVFTQNIGTLAAGNYISMSQAVDTGITYTYEATADGYTGSGSFTPTSGQAVTLNLVASGSSGGGETGATVGDTNNTTGYLGAYSDIWTLPEGAYGITTFKNHTKGEHNHQNFLVVVDDNADCKSPFSVVRADNWENVQWSNSGFESNWDWDNYVSNIQGASVQVKVTNDSGKHIVRADVTTTSGGSFHQTFTKNDSSSGNLYYALSVENAHLTDVETTIYYPVTFTGNEGATVTISKGGEQVDTVILTNGTGTVYLSNGDYTYTAALDGYETKTDGSFTVNNNAWNESFTLTASSVATANYTFTGLPVGAVVTIGESTATADAEGTATFTDLAVGNYDYSITAADYADETGNISVVENGENTRAISLTRVYAVTFTGNEGATVTISRNSTVVGTLTLDAPGTSTINLPDGTYTYTATLSGYTSKEDGSFTVNGGVVSEEFTLDQIAESTITGGWGVGVSDTWTVEPGKTRTVTFTQDEVGAAVWNNFAVLLYRNGSNAADNLRGDYWGDLANSDGNTNTDEAYIKRYSNNWATGDLKGKTITISVSNSGSTVSVLASYKKNETTTAYMQYGNIPINSGSSVDFKLTTDGSTITYNTVTTLENYYPVGNPVTGATWNTDVSDIWELPKGYTATRVFDNESKNTANNYFNYALILANARSKADGNRYAELRADNYVSWGTAAEGHGAATNSSSMNWSSTLRNYMTDARIKMTITNTGDAINVVATYTPASAPTVVITQNYSLPIAADIVYFYLTANTAYLKVYEDQSVTGLFLDDSLGLISGVSARNFPDAAFRTYLNATYATNSKGYFTAAEAAELAEIVAVNQGITDVTGIAYFPNLVKLDIGSNNVTNLDVSANTNLETLWVAVNRGLSSITGLSSLTNLKSFWLWDCNFSSLDLSSNTALTDLNCGGNHLTSLDLSSNTALTSAFLGGQTATVDSVPVASLARTTLDSAMVGNNVSGITFDSTADAFTFNPVVNSFTYNYAAKEGEPTTGSYAMDVTVTFGTPAVLLKSMAPVFDGKVKLKIYMEVPDALKAEGNYFKMTMDGAADVTESVADVATDGYITYSLVPKDMEKQVVIKAYNSNDEELPMIGQLGGVYTTSGYTASLKTYGDVVIAGNAEQTAKTLASRTLDYSAAATNYFAKDTTASTHTIDSSVTAATAADMDSFAISATRTNPTKIKNANISVMFETDNAIRIYFIFADGVDPSDFNFTIDGAAADLQSRTSGETTYYYLTVKNIAAKDLGVEHTFTATCGEEEWTIKASVLSYAKLLLGQSAEYTKTLGKALYAYQQAAVAYFAPTNSTEE